MSMNVTFVTGSDLPTQPPYSATSTRLLRTVIMPSDCLNTEWPFETISGPLYRAIQAEHVTAWVIGFVEYCDRFGCNHRGGYARRYDPTVDSNPNIRTGDKNNLLFEVRPDYNYDIEIDQQGHPKDAP
jgi:hypothetical protein